MFILPSRRKFTSKTLLVNILIVQFNFSLKKLFENVSDNFMVIFPNKETAFFKWKKCTQENN